MKKNVSIVLAAAMLAVILSGCGGTKPAESKGTVNVYNWGEYIDMDLIDEFEAETGIDVLYREYQTNEQMYSVLASGGASYDVIIPSDYMASRLIGEGKLEKINFTNVPNMKLIDDSFKSMEYDPTGEYTVPYMWGTVGIIYDPAVTGGEIDSWSVLFDEQYKGQILMFDNPRDAFGIALKYLGYSMNTTDAAELEAAYNLLEEQKPLLQMYLMDEIFDKLESGEAAIGPYYAGDYLSMLENNPDLEFVVPKEGSNRFVDVMCIPKGAENKANAESFINFMCATETSLRNSEMIGYTSPNTEVEEEIELDDFDRGIMYPDEELLERCEFFINLPKDTLLKYDEYWIKLKS